MAQSLIFIVFVLSSLRWSAASSPQSVLVESKCQEWGFDPSSLSCDVCVVLEEEQETIALRETAVQQCYHCCQKWRRNFALRDYGTVESDKERFRVGSYEFAILQFNSETLEGRYKDLYDFLKEDLQNVKLKKPNIATKEVAGGKASGGIDPEAYREMMMQMMMGGGAAGVDPRELMAASGGASAAPTLLLYKNKNDALKAMASADTDGAEIKPDEQIPVGKLNRDDLKDMLESLVR